MKTRAPVLLHFVGASLILFIAGLLPAGAVPPPAGQRILYFPLDTDPGWPRQGSWAFGKPAGLGGVSFGFPDPATGATGTNVLGYNLSGDYSTSIGGPYYLTAGPFNFTGYTGVQLQFQRWLNTDYPPYVYATIDVSTNGVSWTSVWVNTGTVADAGWTPVSYDLSAYADNRTNIYVRWGHRVGTSGAYAYSGWNLDDIEFDATPQNSDVDHFAFSYIPSPQVSGIPFPVTISALNASNGVATGFNGTAALAGAGNHGAIALNTTNTGGFTAGVWAGSQTVGGWDSNVVLTASDGNGHTGASSTLDVARPVSTFISASNCADMVCDAARGLLYISSVDRVLRYDLNAKSFLTPYVFGSHLLGIDISPDNNTLVVADSSGYNSSNVWAWVVDLPAGTNHQALFPITRLEGGTYSVAFGYDGAVLISSTFQGSGWVPLRRYDPASNTFTVVGNPRQDSMLCSSGDRRIIGIAEANISSGPMDRYDVASQTVNGTVDDWLFNYEVGVNWNGSQFAVPTSGGTFVYDSNLAQVGVVGTYASGGPFGLAYHPSKDLAFFSWSPGSYVRAYETHTLAEVSRYDCGTNFGAGSTGAFSQGRIRVSPDGNNLFVAVGGGIQWITRPSYPPADLGITQSVSPISGDAGSNLTYILTVTNIGPNPATDARVFDRLPPGALFVSANSPQGSCTVSNGLVICTLNPLANGGSATVTIVVTATAGGAYVNTAAAYSSATDDHPTNNYATLTNTVRAGVLFVTPSVVSSLTGPVGGPFVPPNQAYTLTNAGNGALNWTVSNSAAWMSSTATNGTLAAGATAAVTVSPNGLAAGLTRGQYTNVVTFLNSPTGNGNTTRTVTLTANSAPVALTQIVTLAEDGSIPITLQGNDVDSDALTVSITTLPAQGILYQTSDGATPTTAITSVPTTVTHAAHKVIYALPRHGFGNGYGNFLFKVNDGLADSSNALVTINVTHVNHAPVASPDTVTFLVGTPQVSFTVLGNDSDVDGDPVNLQSFTPPTRGLLALSNGVFTYRPNPAFTSGQDQFSYTITDGNGGTNLGQVTILARRGYLNGGDWPTFGNGPSHTGYYPAMIGNGTFATNWTTNFGSSLNQVAVAAGRVYVTTYTYFGATYLTAVDAASGQQSWRHDFASAFSINPPTFDSGSVYVQRGDAASDTQLWRLGAANGSVIWSAPHTAQWERYFAPTVFGSNIWVDGGQYGGMFGFSTNGSSLFFYNGLAQYDQWTPTYYQGAVYSWVATAFTAHNPQTGARLWSLTLASSPPAYSMHAVSAIDGGFACLVTPTSLYGVDLSARTIAWTVTDGFTGSAAVVNGVVYAISGDKVKAYNAHSGSGSAMYQATNDTGLQYQPIITDDALFISSATATYIFNLASHQLMQTIPFGGLLSVANGHLYIAGGDGWLRDYVISGSYAPLLNYADSHLSGRTLTLTFYGLPGWTYRVQCATSLATMNWQDIGTVQPDNSGLCQFLDSPPANSAPRYYRLTWP